MIINDLFNNKKTVLAEFAPQSGGDSGNYFQALASAWYNGTYDSGSLQKGIKSQEDVERLLQRGVVCPDGKTRKFEIGYNSDFDGVVISSDDYYEHSDYDDNGKEVDSRTGRPWGPYDYMEFKDEELDESAKWRDPKYKGQLYTQEKPDYRDTREYDRAVWDPKPKGYPGRKKLGGDDGYSNTDPLTKGFGRSGIKHSILDRGKRKGLPSRGQITSLKGSIKDVHGKHTRANLPEQGIAENQDWMKDLAARAAKMSKPGTPYVPPKQDPEKARRDLTAKYPNIDELVAQAELNRDPDYQYAEGEAYYRGREAEHEYQRLKQIQRVIQGLNEMDFAGVSQTTDSDTGDITTSFNQGPMSVSQTKTPGGYTKQTDQRFDLGPASMAQKTVGPNIGAGQLAGTTTSTATNNMTGQAKQQVKGVGFGGATGSNVGKNYVGASDDELAQHAASVFKENVNHLRHLAGVKSVR